MMIASIKKYLLGHTREQPATVPTLKQTQIDVEMLAAKDLCMVNAFLCFKLSDKVVSLQVDSVAHTTTCHSIVFQHNDKNTRTKATLVGAWLQNGSNLLVRLRALVGAGWF